MEKVRTADKTMPEILGNYWQLTHTPKVSRTPEQEFEGRQPTSVETSLTMVWCARAFAVHSIKSNSGGA